MFGSKTNKRTEVPVMTEWQCQDSRSPWWTALVLHWALSVEQQSQTGAVLTGSNAQDVFDPLNTSTPATPL